MDIIEKFLSAIEGEYRSKLTPQRAMLAMIFGTGPKWMGAFRDWCWKGLTDITPEQEALYPIWTRFRWNMGTWVEHLHTIVIFHREIKKPRASNRICMVRKRECSLYV